MDSDEADTPEINFHFFMAQKHREQKERKKKFKVAQKQEIYSIKLRDEFGNIRMEEDKSNFRSVLCRLFGAIFFLGIGIGALVFSVYKSPNDEQFHTHPPPTTPPPKICDPFQNMTCASSGLYIYEKRINDHGEYALLKMRAQWYQDDTHRKVRLILGDPLKTDYREYVGFSDRLYTIYPRGMVPHCLMNASENYQTFIESFGGPDLRYEHEVTLTDFQTTAWVFSGRNSAGVNVFRYTSTNYTDMMYGWKGYPFSDILNVRHYEYWFGSCMTKVPGPDPSIFNLPSECPTSLD